MSEENVEAFKRANEAFNRGDVDALLQDLDAEGEFHPELQALLGGEATVYRGHEGVREFFHDTYEAFAEMRIEYSEIRDLGDRLVAIGRLHARGRQSGAEIEGPIGAFVEFSGGKLTRIASYANTKRALEAAGLRE
jgi:ketosteroid isomerase-like protein